MRKNKSISNINFSGDGGEVSANSNSWSSRAKRDAELHSQYGSGGET